MRTDLPFVIGSTLLGLFAAGLFGVLVWLGTGSLNYGAGAMLFAMYMVGPFAAWFVDRKLPASQTHPSSQGLSGADDSSLGTPAAA